MSEIRVVADDLGWSHDVDAGIQEAAAAGMLSAVSALATGPTVESGLEKLRSVAPEVPVGLHLDLSDFAPCAPIENIASLAASAGSFTRRSRALLPALLAGTVRSDEVACELVAQLEKLKALGVHVAHLDGHRHVHLFPGVAGPVADQVRKRGIAYVRTFPWSAVIAVRARALPERAALCFLGARLRQRLAATGARTPDALVGLAQGYAPDTEDLASAIEAARDGALVEIVTHPGREPAGPRLRDLEALRSQRLRAALAHHRETHASSAPS